MSSPPPSSSYPTPAPPTNRRRAYLLKSDQPFARSALKRQSVMTLPSIAHLQHGFAKIGLEGKEREKENRSIAGGRMGRTSEGRRSEVHGFEEDSKDSRGEGEEDDEGLILGPEPERPTMNVVLPWEAGEPGRSVKDENELRVQVLVALDEVRRLWSLNNENNSNETPTLSNLVLTTTSSIRSVQQWMTSLPSNSTSASSTSNLLHTPSDPLAVSTAARPRTSLGTPATSALHSRRSSSIGVDEEELPMTERERLLIEVRKRSLDVLGMLKELEERHRKDDSLDSTTARSKTTLSDTALVSQADEEKDTAEIAVYDETVMLETLTKESELVEEWVDTVKSLLELSGDMKARRGRRSEGSLGDEGFSEGQAESGDQKLPSWAEQDGFESSLDRAFSIIQAHLPSSATSQLPSLSLPLSSIPASRLDFLSILSTGTLLCQSYNLVLASSSSPFGFIPTASIHEFPQSEAGSTGMERSWSGASDGGEKVGNTFRRVQNLQGWAAALKHRYSITLSAASNSPSSTTVLDSNSPSFDARVIASKKEGWEGMLETAIGDWAEAVAREERENC